MSEPFKNPLTFSSIVDMIAAIMNAMVIIATPIIVFFLIYAGFMYVTAQGNPEKIQAASRSLLYGVIGGVIVLGSVAILVIIKSVVDAF